MPIDAGHTLHAWQLFTRLGEAQILLPAAAVALVALLRDAPGRRLAAWWLGLGAAATLLTTATKVAFIGWGVGSAALDFTGISGHAMFAALVYPLLLAALAPSAPAPLRPPPTLALVLGAALAIAVGLSRVRVQAHSWSEVILGLALGGAACAIALWRTQAPQRRLTPWLPVAAALWLVITPAVAPPSQTHPMVTRLALALAGHERPYTRAQLHAGAGRGWSRPAPAAPRKASIGGDVLR